MKQVYAVGADIGGTSIKLAIISMEGNIKDKWEIDTNKENQGASIPSDIWKSVEAKLIQNNIPKGDIQGIGAGAPGFVNKENGDIYEAVNLGWKNFDLARQLENLSGLPVFVENDANIAALGENWKGSGNQAENMIAITLGTGVGGGIIVNGSVVNGANGTGGEIGHIMVDPGGVRCNCGRHGCLETITSATGIVRQAVEAVNTGEPTLLNSYASDNGTVTAKDVFEAANAGDQKASAIITRVTEVLGLAIANAAVLINPSKIVIGGGVSKAGEQLLVPLRKVFNRCSLARISQACEFEIAKLGNDAGVIGAAYLVQQELKQDELSV